MLSERNSGTQDVGHFCFVMGMKTLYSLLSRLNPRAKEVLLQQGQPAMNLWLLPSEQPYWFSGAVYRQQMAAVCAGQGLWSCSMEGNKVAAVLPERVRSWYGGNAGRHCQYWCATVRKLRRFVVNCQHEG